MALAAGVVVFSNLMSQAGIGVALQTSDVDGPAGASPASPASPFPSATGATTSPTQAGTPPTQAGSPPVPAGEYARLSLVRTVAVQQWQWSAVGIAGAGVAAGGVGWLVSRRMLRPIDRITATANRISATTLHERIALEGPDDELRRLSGTVDALLDRLESAFARQRRFVAQASHELRTPLAVQRAAVQIGLEDGATPEDIRVVRQELLEQNRRTERLVESLLLLAEADRGLVGARHPIDFGELADEAVTGATASARAAGVTLAHSRRPGSPTEVPVLGEPTLVRQVIVNLVGNAVEYNERGGFVRVTARSDGVVVENSGPIVPADVAPLLTEPFRRARPADEPSCGGSAATERHNGLGLSIVAAIVQAHGWQLEVRARVDGGLLVRVSSV